MDMLMDWLVHHTDGPVVMDGLTDSVVLSYRWSGSDGWSDRLVFMVDEWSDNEGQPDRQGKMAYRQSGRDRWSYRQIAGLMVGVTDRHANDKLMVFWLDWSYDGWTWMTDGLAMSWTDSVTDVQVN